MLVIEPETGKIVGANQAAARFYGRSFGELCKMSIDEINTLPPDEVATKQDIAAQGGTPVSIFRQRVFSGEMKTVEMYSSPITMGRRKLLFSVIREISCRAVDNDTDRARVTETGLK
jgi:PAS domain S-box-containing protein